MKYSFTFRIALILALVFAIVGCGRIWGTVTWYGGGPFTLQIYGVNSIGTTACRMFMLKNLDGTGNYLTASNNIPVTLSGNKSGTFYSDPGCTTSTSLTTIPQGKSYALFYFKDNTVESLTFQGISPNSNNPTLPLATVLGGSTSWVNLTGGLPSSPSARSYQGGAFHLQRGTTIIYGGQDNTPSAKPDMWEFVGTTWNQLCSNCSPGPREREVFVYDKNRNVIVLFGGDNNDGGPGNYQNDLWEWNGATWTQRTNILGAPPSARASAFGVYDSNRNRVVIFGGQDNTGTNLNDIYEYDGTSWFHPLPGGAPSIRFTGGSADNNVVFDPIHNRSIFYGGVNAGTDYDDLFTWDGTNFTTQCSPNCTGTARESSFTDFDASRNKLVLAQGCCIPGEVAGTWEIDGTTFASVGPTLGDPGDPGNQRDGGTFPFNPFTGKHVYFGGNICGVGCNWGETWIYGAP